MISRTCLGQLVSRSHFPYSSSSSLSCHLRNLHLQCMTARQCQVLGLECTRGHKRPVIIRGINIIAICWTEDQWGGSGNLLVPGTTKVRSCHLRGAIDPDPGDCGQRKPFHPLQSIYRSIEYSCFMFGDVNSYYFMLKHKY